nr:MAG TPA: hypothetical protein [Caudoviricetes sp.]
MHISSSVAFALCLETFIGASPQNPNNPLY